MRRLYHGTSRSNADAIMRDGFRCRSDTGMTNYSGVLSSNPHCIYFTDSYPFFYAGVSAESSGGSVIAVDVDGDVLEPDEDFLRMGQVAGEDELWLGDISLEALGTCRVRRSDLEFVDIIGRRDFVVADAVRFGDPHVTISSHRAMKLYYRALTQGWFDAGVFPELDIGEYMMRALTQK